MKVEDQEKIDSTKFVSETFSYFEVKTSGEFAMLCKAVAYWMERAYSWYNQRRKSTKKKGQNKQEEKNLFKSVRGAPVAAPVALPGGNTIQ